MPRQVSLGRMGISLCLSTSEIINYTYCPEDDPQMYTINQKLAEHLAVRCKVGTDHLGNDLGDDIQAT